MASAHRAATPGATEPTVRKAVRSIQSGGAVFNVEHSGKREAGEPAPEYAGGRPEAQTGYNFSMADSIRDLFFGAVSPGRELVEAIEPRRSFDDVVLPATTMRALNHALALVRKHDLIFHQWGLAERHSTGLGLAFHFAGPPGTGKTICAEALAYALKQKLLVVRYAELESRWVGQTSKHVATVFRAAAREDAVLFFDEADAIAGRRFTTMGAAYEREANAIVNVLLHELETFPGVVIFATNLAANIDPAFERRIRTHILFTMPDVEERERIWQVQLHARKTPLAEDVDFRALAAKYPRSGGDIKNAVLKGAQIATVEPGPDSDKRIHQRHFVQGMEEVIAGESVMSQSLFDDAAAMAGGGVMDRLVENQEELRGELGLLAERMDGLAADRSSSRLIESFTAARRRKDLILVVLALAAMALAVAALAAALLGGSASP
jgi:SpoVK/Ycf46/Vps4 family AAA+-type ATPase